MSELIILSEPKIENLIVKAAKVYSEVLTKLYEVDRQLVSAWPGGRSLLKFFPALIDVMSNVNKEISESSQFFQVDERVFQDFNREILEENFFSTLVEKKAINRSQVHYFPTELAPEQGLADYSALLDSYGSKFNYVMLGAGYPHQRDGAGKILSYDCHVAGIFPHHPSSEPHNSQFYYYFDSPKPPSGRITATCELLSKSDWCFLFIIGQDKKEVLREFLSDNTSVADAPVHLAKKIKNCVLITDQKV